MEDDIEKAEECVDCSDQTPQGFLMDELASGGSERKWEMQGTEYPLNRTYGVHKRLCVGGIAFRHGDLHIPLSVCWTNSSHYQAWLPREFFFFPRGSRKAK